MSEIRQQDIAALQERVRLLEAENARLASQSEDMLLLGLIHETISSLQDTDEILAQGLERISLLKDIPFCCCGSLEHDHLQVAASSLSFCNETLDGRNISLAGLSTRERESRLLDAVSSAAIKMPFAEQFQASEILLIPFSNRDFSSGMFMFASDSDDGDHLQNAFAMLHRVSEALVLAMDNVHIIAELKTLNATLDQRVDQRTRQWLESEAQYRSLIDQAMDGIFVFDPEHGRFLDINAPACRKLGYSREQMRAITVFDIVEGMSIQRFNEDMQRLQEQGTAIVEGVHICHDGSTYPVETHMGMILLKGQVSVLAISHDITEQRQAEAQLLQAQKMEGVGTLVGGIAHDFNNMLAGMTGNLYLIGHDASLSSEGRARIDRINELCDRAANMIAQLLTFARKGMIRMQPIEFNKFLQEALELAELGIPENIRVKHDFDMDDVCTVMGDHVQLQQLVLNLLVNARDAVKSVHKPCISIGLQRIEQQSSLHEVHQGLAEGPWVALSVGDNGCGIPESIRDQLFDPFFTTKEVGEGTGLGLSTVYGVVQSHQGAIEIDSKEHEGTTFRIYFPLHNEQSVEYEERSEALPKGAGETVLLVDDEEIVLTTTSALLTHLGYRVITAYNGVDALGKDGLESVDIAVLDVVMPEMGGVETANRLRAINPDLPVIFATAYDRHLVLSKQDRLPNSSVLSKPFRLQALAKILKERLSST